MGEAVLKGESAAWLSTFATNALVLALSLCTGVIISRLLLPAGRGQLAVVLFWPQLMAGVGLLSINQALTYQSGNDSEDSGTLAVTGLWLALSLACVVLFCGYFLIPLVLGASREAIASLSRAYLLTFLPFNFLALCLSGVEQGRLRFARYNVGRTVAPGVYFIAVVFLWFIDSLTVASIVSANVLGSVAAATAGFLLKTYAIRRKPSVALAKRVLLVGSRFHFLNLSVFAAAQADLLIVILFLPDADVGLYAVAHAVAGAPLAVIAETFRAVTFPRVSNRAHNQNPQHEILTSLRYSVPVLSFSALCVIVACPFMIRVLYGESFGPAALPAIVLTLAYVPKALRAIASHGLQGLGEARAGGIAELLAVVGVIVLAVPLVVFCGLLGSALALLVGNCVALGFLIRSFERRLEIPRFSSLYHPSVYRSLIAAVRLGQ